MSNDDKDPSARRKTVDLGRAGIGSATLGVRRSGAAIEADFSQRMSDGPAVARRGMKARLPGMGKPYDTAHFSGAPAGETRFLAPWEKILSVSGTATSPAIAARHPRVLKAWNPSLRERIGNWVYDRARTLGLSASAQRYRNVATGAVDFIPGLGDTVGVQEAYRDYQAGNHGSAAVGSGAAILGLVPYVGDAAAKGIRSGWRSRSDLFSRLSGIFAKRYSDADIKMYDHPKMPPRPLEMDYKWTPDEHPDGRYKIDMEGRELKAPPHRIAGRSSAKGDQPIDPREIDNIIFDLTGSRTRGIPAEKLSREAGLKEDEVMFGRTWFDAFSRPVGVDVASELTPEQASKVRGHELGHVIDLAVGQMSKWWELWGIRGELERNYHVAVTGTPAKGRLRTPKDERYKTWKQQRRELVAEAFRSYMTSPGEFKANYPRTAARIRAFVNLNPRVNHFIQFNSVAAPMAVGGLTGLGLSGLGRPNDDRSSDGDHKL